MYLEVLGKFNFGDDYKPLYKTFYDGKSKSKAEAKKDCLEYIRDYRSNQKSVEFIIKDESKKIVE